MPEFIENILVGIRQWVNGKLDDITYVVSSHINSLTSRVTTLETDAVTSVKVGGTALTKTNNAVDVTASSGVKTESGVIKANLKSYTAAGSAATTKSSTGTLYPVELDSNGALAVTVPSAAVTGIKSGEKILGFDATNTTELTSTLTIAVEKQNNIDYIVLKGINNAEVAKADASAFVKDGMIEAAAIYKYASSTWTKVSGDTIDMTGQSGTEGHEYIVLKWNSDSTPKTITLLDVSDLIDTYIAGNGINITNNVISVIAPTVSQVLAILDADEEEEE